jgi:hypothetical protein
VTELDADEILRALLCGRVDFLLIGGLAVAVHGYPRATKDIDIVPGPDAENTRRLYDVLVELGAQPLEVGDFRTDELPVPFAPEGLAEGGNWALTTRHGRIDVMQWIPGIDDGFDELSPNALSVDLEGVGTVKVAGYADVVRMKRAAGRPQDLVDLERLREATGEP